MKTGNFTEARTEKAEEKTTKSNDEVGRGVNEKVIVKSTLTGSVTAKARAGVEIEVLKYGIIKHRSIPTSFSNDLGNKYQLDTSSVLTGKVNVVLTSAPYCNRSARA